MATFRNYEPRSEGLNAAYEMLLQAELAKAQAMGNAFAPLTDAIRSGQQMKIARDEQARLTKSQAEDNALRTQRMGLDTRELDLREKQLNRAMSQDEAFARALTLFPEHAPAASGVPFTGGGSAAMTQRPPLSAGGLLGQPQPQMDPSALAAMGGENASRYIGIQNTLADNQRADAKIAYDQQQETSEQKAYADYLKGLEKELPPEQIPGFKARMGTKEGRSKGYEEIGKLMGEKGKAARENTEFDTYRTNLFKDWRKAHSADAKKMGEIAEIETWSKGLPGTPEEKRKALDKRAEDFMGIGKEEKPARGIDLPGIGSNITLNTSLDRREKGASYFVRDGQVNGISEAERGELNRLVDVATSRDSLFNDPLMLVLAGDKMPGGYRENLEKARAVARSKAEQDILSQLGWTKRAEAELPYDVGAQRELMGAEADTPPQNIQNEINEGIMSKKIPATKEGIAEFLRSRYSGKALSAVVDRSKEAAVQQALGAPVEHKGDGKPVQPQTIPDEVIRPDVLQRRKRAEELLRRGGG